MSVMSSQFLFEVAGIRVACDEIGIRVPVVPFQKANQLITSRREHFVFKDTVSNVFEQSIGDIAEFVRLESLLFGGLHE